VLPAYYGIPRLHSTDVGIQTLRIKSEVPKAIEGWCRIEHKAKSLVFRSGHGSELSEVMIEVESKPSRKYIEVYQSIGSGYTSQDLTYQIHT